MLTQPSPSSPSASLLVLEPGASFPFEAMGYRGGSDTAIIVQQRGESSDSLRRRIRHAAKQLQQSGVVLETVALIVAAGGLQVDRRSTAVALAELLDAHRTLVLIADKGSAALQHELIGLVGALIERDHVEQSIAVDFDAKRMSELRGRGSPLLQRPEPSSEQYQAQLVETDLGPRPAGFGSRIRRMSPAITLALVKSVFRANYRTCARTAGAPG